MAINRSPPRITRSYQENALKVTWNPNDLGNATSRVSIQIARFKNEHGHIKFHNFQPIMDDQENNGESTINEDTGDNDSFQNGRKK